MAIDQRDVVWDSPLVDEKDIVWDAPVDQKEQPGFLENAGRFVSAAGKGVVDAVKRVGDYVTSGEQNEEIESPVAATKRVVGEVVDTAKKLPAIASRGYVGGQFASAINEDNPNPETVANLYREQQKIGKGIAPTAQEKRTQSGMGVFENFAANPISFITEVGVSSLAGMAPEAIKSAPRIVAGSMATGAAAGALGVGAPTGGLGAPAGAVVGATAGLAASLPLVAYQSSAVQKQAELFVTELQARGVDVNNPNALKAAFSNPALINDIKSKVALPSAITGFFDGLSALAGGNVESAVSRRMALSGVGKTGRRIAGEAADFGVQSVAGMSGEAGSQVAYSGRITDPNAVYAEGLAETPIQSLATRGIKGLAGMANKSMLLSGALNQPMQNNPLATDNAVLENLSPDRIAFKQHKKNITSMQALLRARGVDIAPQQAAQDNPEQEQRTQSQQVNDSANRLANETPEQTRDRHKGIILKRLSEGVSVDPETLLNFPDIVSEHPELVEGLHNYLTGKGSKIDSEEAFNFLDSVPEGTVFQSDPSSRLVLRKKNILKSGTEEYELVPDWFNHETGNWEENASALKLVRKRHDGVFTGELTTDFFPSPYTSISTGERGVDNVKITRPGNNDQAQQQQTALPKMVEQVARQAQAQAMPPSGSNIQLIQPQQAQVETLPKQVISEQGVPVQGTTTVLESPVNLPETAPISAVQPQKQPVNLPKNILSPGEPTLKKSLTVQPNIVNEKQVAEVRKKIDGLRSKGHNFLDSIRGVVLPNGVVKGRDSSARGDGIEKSAQKLFQEANDLEEQWFAALYPEKFTADEMSSAISSGLPHVPATNKPSLTVQPETDKKDPWQITRKKFYDIASGNKLQDNPTEENANEFYGTVKSGGKPLLIVGVTDEKVILPWHKEIVQKAISEGKSVPPEVLAEYPELAPAPQETLQNSNPLDADFLKKAEQAYGNTSHRPGDAAQVELTWLNDSVDEIRKEIEKHVPNFDNSEKSALLNRFRHEYIKRRGSVFSARSGSYSSLVSGRSNLNSNQVKTRNSSVDKAESSFRDWLRFEKKRIFKEAGVEQAVFEKRKAQDVADRDAKVAIDALEKKKREEQRALPIINSPSEGVHHITKEEWSRTHSDYKTVMVSDDGRYRYRSMIVDGALTPVYLSDQKNVAVPESQKVRKDTPAQNVPDEYAQAGEKVTVNKGKGRREYRGEIARTLKGTDGKPVYEVKPDGMDSTFRVDGADIVFDRSISSTPGASVDKTGGIDRTKETASSKFSSTLRKAADTMQNRINERRNPATAGLPATNRRAGIIAGMAAEADQLESIQGVLRGMADAIDAGTLPKALWGVTTKAQVEMFRPGQKNEWKWARPSTRKSYVLDVIMLLKGKPGASTIRDDAALVLKNGVSGDEYIALIKKENIPALEKLIALGKKFSSDAHTLKNLADDVAKAKRMFSAGITDESKFIAAKEAIDGYLKPKSSEDVKRDQIKKAEADLIGTKIPGFFPTPKSIAADMVEMADIKPGMSVLEPSAGKGDIAEAIKAGSPDAKLSVIEVVPSLSSLLEKKGFDVVDSDFMEHTGQYDRIIMNPPFENGADGDHVQHAYKLLKPGGKIVAIMGEGTFFRNDKKATAFREWLDSVDGTSEKMDSGSFKGAESFRQTGTATRMVEIEKPQVASKAEAKQEQSESEASNKPVKDRVREQLRRSGTFTEEQNEAGAMFVSEFYTAKAKELGITPEELYAKIPYTITRGDVGGGSLKQGALSPIFYSQLARKMADAPDKIFSNGKVVSLWLKSNAGKLGIKKDELYWTGVNEWLEAQGKVSKADVLAYLKDNGVQVDEVMKPGELLKEYYPERTFEDPDTGEIADYNDFKDRYNDLSEEELSGETPEDALSRLIDEIPSGVDNTDVDTKYSDYQLHGGTNYRELLLTLPDKSAKPDWRKTQDGNWAFFVNGKQISGAFKNESDKDSALDTINPSTQQSVQGQFKSSHWEEPNILAHVRFNDRTDVDGNKVLFIEEVQSDWGQEGKKRGFVVSEGDKLYDSFADVFGGNPDGGIPSAPFVTDTKAWTSLAIKRMIRYAAENGYDKVAFINGEQSAERYDLSKQVDNIRVGRKTDTTTEISIWDKAGNSIDVPTGKKLVTDGYYEVENEKLPDIIGKELANKIISGGTHAVYEGADLKVGGEGMKAFYDKIVPSVAGDIVKKLGGKMDAVEIAQGNDRELIDDNGNDYVDKAKRSTQIGFTITPSMRESVMQGQALFQQGEKGTRGGFDLKTLTTILTKDSDFSTFLHETSHFYLEAQAKMAAMDGASPQIMGDMETLLEWFGVKDLPTWNKIGIARQREHHEAFAYNFEIYLSEGTSPNAAMKGVFERLKEWLKQVYKEIKKELNKIYKAEHGKDLPILTGEVRKVMDNMFTRDLFEKAKAEKGAATVTAKDKPVTGVDGKKADIIANGKEYGQIEYRVVELGDIVSSHDPFTFKENPKYPQERQNRDYSLLDVRGKAEDAIDGITEKNFKEVLYPTLASDSGIPVINESGVVLSGNNRTFAIQRGHKEYKAALLGSDLKQFGVDADAVAEMKQPVLVRVMSDKAKEGDFVIDSNVSKVKTLTSGEIRKHYNALPQAKKELARKAIAGIYGEFNKSEDAKINTFLGNLFVSGLPLKIKQALMESGVLSETDIQGSQFTSVGVEKVKMLALTLLNEDMKASSQALDYLTESKEGNANLDRKFDAAIGDLFRLRDEQPDIYRQEMQDIGNALERSIDFINHPDWFKASTRVLSLKMAAKGASITDEPLNQNAETYLAAMLSPTIGSLRNVVADKVSNQVDLFEGTLARPGAAVGDLKREGNMVEELPTKEMKPHAGLEKREAVIAEDAGLDEGYTARIKTPFYEVISNVQTVNEAIKLIERYDDIMEVLDVIRDEKNDIPGHVRIGVAEVVVRRLSEAYRKTKDNNILEKQNEFMDWELNYGENTARALQAMSMYSRLTPEGFLMQVKKGIKKAKDNHYKENKKDVDALLAAIKEGDAFSARRSVESEAVRKLLGKLGDEEQRLWGQYVSWFSETMDIVAMARRTTREYGALEEFARKVKNLFKEKLPDIKLEKPDRMNSISLVRSQIANFKELRQAWRDAREELIARSKGDEKIAALERLIPQELGTPFTTADIRKVMREMGYFNVKNIARTWGEDRKSLTNTIIEALIEDQNNLTSEEYRFTVKALKAEIDGIVDAEKQRMADYRQKLTDIKKRKDEAVKEQQERTGGKSIDVADRVARKYLQLAKEKKLTPPLQILFRDMVSALSGDFKKEEGASAKPDYSRAVYHAIRNAGKYIEAWDSAKQKVLEQFPDKSDEINKAFDEITSHVPGSAVRGLIREQMKEQQTKLSDVVRQYFSEKQGAYSKTLADAIASKFPDFTMEEVTMLSDAVMKEFDGMAKQARFSALKSLANRGNRTAKAIKPEWQRVIEMAKLGALSNEEFYNMFAKPLNLPVYSTEIANKIMELGKIIEDAPDGLSKRIAILNMTKYISTMNGFKTIDFSKGVFYANILSGVNTSIVNMLDTYTHVLGEVSLLAKRDPKATAFIFSRLFDGLKTGRFDAFLELKYGVSAFDDKWAHSKGFMEVANFGQKGGVPIGNKYVRSLLESKPMAFANIYKYVSRMLTAQDLIAQRGAKEAKAAAMAYDIAVAKGLRGADAIFEAKNILAINDLDAIKQQARSEGYDGAAFESRVNELVDELRPNEINEESIEFAGYATYNHEPEGFLGAVAQRISTLSGEYPKLSFLVPFTRIVANVTNRKLDYFTPVALWRASKADGEVARATLYKKAFIGLASVAGLAMLEVAGLVVVHGAGPDDWRKRKQMQANGWMPYSLEIGGYFIDYRLLPVSFMLAAYGNAQDMIKNGIVDKLDAGRLLAYSVLMTTSVISSQNFLSGMSELFSLISARDISGVKKLERISTGIATGLVFPSLARDAYRMFDSNSYSAEGVWGNVVRNVPYIGALSGADKELNVLAQPVSVSFFRSVKTKQDDPLWRMIWEKKINIPVVAKTTQFDGKVLTPKQFREYQILYGTDMRQYLQQNLTAFKLMSPADINKNVLVYSEVAKADAKIRLGIDVDVE